jgi:hypothetical protein
MTASAVRDASRRGRLSLVVESAVTPQATLANVQRLGREVLPAVSKLYREENLREASRRPS